MDQNQSWRDNSERSAIADDLSGTLLAQSRAFTSGVMGAYVSAPDFSSPFFSGVLSDMNGALRLGLQFMAGAEGEDAPLSTLYCNLANIDRELLDAAFADAVDFYGFRPRLERWRHLGSLSAYLDALSVRADKTLADDYLKPELLLHHALIRFMADLFDMDDEAAWDRPLFLREAVEAAEGIAWEKALAFLPRAPEASELSAFYAELDERGGIFKAAVAARDALRDAENGWALAALSYVLGHMTALIESDCRIGPAVKYALSAYGARGSDCDAIGGVRLEEVEDGRFLVWTPAGRRLGSIAERHDGLWFAGGMVADSRDSAVGLLIEERTRIMRARCEEGAHRHLRVYVADECYAPREGRFVCEIWNEDHGLSDAGAIEFALGDGGASDARYRGVVEDVQDRRILIKDIVSSDGDVI